MDTKIAYLCIATTAELLIECTNTFCHSLFVQYCRTLHDFFFTSSLIAPSSPPLNVAAVAVNATAISVSWKSPPIIHHNSPLTGYVIIYSDLSSPGGGDEVEVNIWDPTVFTTVLFNLEPYSLYDVQVAAVNEAGAGPRSPEITVETPKASQCCARIAYRYRHRV